MHCFVSLSIVRFVFSRIARLNNICLTDLLVASKINSVQSSWYFIYCMRRCCENRVLCSEASDQTHVRDARCCVLFITPGTLHENEGAEVPGDKLHNQSEASANLFDNQLANDKFDPLNAEPIRRLSLTIEHRLQLPVHQFVNSLTNQRRGYDVLSRLLLCFGRVPLRRASFIFVLFSCLLLCSVDWLLTISLLFNLFCEKNGWGGCTRTKAWFHHGSDGKGRVNCFTFWLPHRVNRFRIFFF